MLKVILLKIVIVLVFWLKLVRLDEVFVLLKGVMKMVGISLLKVLLM